VFGQGTKKADEPIYAIFVTYMIAQITMFADINRIASFITMTVRILIIIRTGWACIYCYKHTSYRTLGANVLIVSYDFSSH